MACIGHSQASMDFGSRLILDVGIHLNSKKTTSEIPSAFQRHCYVHATTLKKETCPLKLPHVVARTPLTSGRTCGTSCRMSRPLASACVWRFMWTPLMRTRFARTACPGSWIPSPSGRVVPAPGVMLYAPLLPPLFFWLEPLWRTTLCLRARVCSLLWSCVALSLLSRCSLCLVLLGVAPFRSAPLGVLRPKPRWGRAWSPICCCSSSFLVAGLCRSHLVKICPQTSRFCMWSACIVDSSNMRAGFSANCELYELWRSAVLSAQSEQQYHG
jgi:hypothetical protein